MTHAVFYLYLLLISILVDIGTEGLAHLNLPLDTNMSTNYNLRSQRSAKTISAEIIPDTRSDTTDACSESSLTSVPANRQTTTSTSEKSSDSRVDGSVLKPGRSYSDVVRMRPDMSRPGTETCSVNVISIIDKPSTAFDTNEEVCENPFVTTSESSSESNDESHKPCQTVERHRKKPGKASEIDPRASRNTKPRMNDQERSDLIKEAEKQRILKRKQATSSGPRTGSILG